MKLKQFISRLLTNKTTLYVVFTLSLFNLLGYLIMGNIEATLYFILFGFLGSLFSKNFIIILLIPLVLVNSIVLLQKTSKKIYEGMTNTSDKEKSQKKTTADEMPKNKLNQNNKSKTKTNQGLPITPLEHEDKQVDDVDINEIEQTNTESFEMVNSKKNSAYNIDYASTIEDAYDQLNGILGSDGIKRLTTDTQSLVQQQMQLTKAMEGMQPLIKNMKPLLENMGPLLDQAKGIMGANDNKNLVDMAKKMSTSLPK